MRKQLAVLLLLAGMASWCHAQNAPKEVMEIMKDYIKDPAISFGFNEAKRMYRLDSTLKFNDITVDVPVERYALINSLLEKSNDSVDVQSVIKPVGSWRVFIHAKGKGLYFLEIDFLNGSWEITTMGTGAKLLNEWDKIRAAWPESKNIHPILIQDNGYEYIHFAKMGKYNLKKLYAEYSKNTKDSVSMFTSPNYANLEDCRKIFKYVKKENNEKKKMREGNKNLKGVGYGGGIQ